jgi:hypothetical protein
MNWYNEAIQTHTIDDYFDIINKFKIYPTIALLIV